MGRRSLTGLLSAAWLVALVPTMSMGFSSGVRTTNFADPNLGCNNCHSGGTEPIVELNGPPSVEAGSAHEYTLRVSAVGSQQSAGLNVSAAAGVLSTGGTSSAGTQGVIGSGGLLEITHNAAKASSNGWTEFSFLWEAPDTGTASLRAWGCAVNSASGNQGDRAALATLEVSVVAAPTATPTATSTPTATATPTATSSDTPTASPTASATATPTVPEQLCPLDVDFNGLVNAATDGVYIYRRLLGLQFVVPLEFRLLDPTIQGDAIVGAAVDALGGGLDVDGDQNIFAATDGVYVFRRLQGLQFVVPEAFRMLDPSIPDDATVGANVDALCP